MLQLLCCAQIPNPIGEKQRRTMEQVSTRAQYVYHSRRIIQRAFNMEHELRCDGAIDSNLRAARVPRHDSSTRRFPDNYRVNFTRGTGECKRKVFTLNIRICTSQRCRDRPRGFLSLFI